VVGIGPALVGEDALAGFDDSESVARFVSVGVPGRMPGFETRLTPDEIDAVAEFVFSGLGS
jgi:mono/diheme cytochrome c family protein